MIHTSTGNRRIFINDDGEWSIWRSPQIFTNGNRVGPGYIGRFKHTSGQILVDDTIHSIQTLNDPRAGGLGAFGLCIGQRNEHFPDHPYNFTWDVTERKFAADGGAGFGVLQFRETAPTELSGKIIYGCETDLGVFGKRLVTIKRRYVFRDSGVSVLVNVIANPDDLPGYFVKEPKFVAHSLGPANPNGPRYDRVDVFRVDGTLLISKRLSDLPNPDKKTMQIGFDSRCRIRFSDPERGNWFFNIVAEAASSTAPYYLDWENGGNAGLDRWAVLSDSRESISNSGGDYCLQGPPNGSKLTRQWEVSKFQYPMTPQTGVMLHAWEGGTGYPDCLVCYRPLVREQFDVRLDFSYNTGWKVGREW